MSQKPMDTSSLGMNLSSVALCDCSNNSVCQITRLLFTRLLLCPQGSSFTMAGTQVERNSKGLWREFRPVHQRHVFLRQVSKQLSMDCLEVSLQTESALRRPPAG